MSSGCSNEAGRSKELGRGFGRAKEMQVAGDGLYLTLDKAQLLSVSQARTCS